MAIRMSGLTSGLDTDSIVEELVKAKSEKKTTYEQEQKKLGWKQEKWKTLNTQVYSFYSKNVSNMLLKSDYYKKTTTSTSSAVSVVTGSNAALCNQTLENITMAKAGYLTGAKLANYSKTNEDGTTTSTAPDGSTLVTALDSSLKDKTLTITGSKGTVDITIDDTTTLTSLAKQMQNAGVSANYDANNQRFYISASSMGEDADFSISGDDTLLTTLGIADNQDGSHRIKGTNASITLNGVEYTSTSNTFNINDLTITLNNETDDSINLATKQDTDGIYSMIKSFFTGYNEVIKAIDVAYNADSASEYSMLTDDEKEAMSDDEVEDWENKIKDSLLRSDSTLGNIFNSLKTLMLEGIEVDGETLHLSDFGINTLSYFSAGDNEKAMYHIDGDPDDSDTSGNTDVLKATIASDPDKVVNFFSQLSKDMYAKLGDLMARTDYSSAFTIYDDKLLQDQYDDYTDKIDDQEDLIETWEDYYYSKFTSMETALTNLQSKQNAISGLLS